jgi:WXG100 family type VII secretion target
VAYWSEVQTSEEGMQAAGQEFANAASDFTQKLQNVNTEMATLQASWDGQASANFNSAMDSWEAAFQRVINELLGLLDAMGVNTKEYRGAEDSASEAAASFSSALPGI